jgi:hypothetical protein
MKVLQYFKRAARLAISDPRRIPTLVGRETNYAARRLNQIYYRLRGKPDGYDLMDADWDTVIILDACRYDYFENRKRLQRGTLRKETAPGGESREFMRRQFMGKTLHDTVYVTGNPHTSMLDPETFHEVYIDEAWSEIGNEVPADRVTEVAVEAHESHPNKRIIVHYMQPHLPILDPDMKHINELLEPTRGQYWPADTTMMELREAYAANLEYGLESVERLINEIEGKIVVTADHGELLGERQSPIPVRGTDHHPELYVPELIEVPWLTIEKGERREVRDDPPVGSISVDEKTKENRLEALGYLTPFMI